MAAIGKPKRTRGPVKYGFSPNGKRLIFAEHVFYLFRDGRIAAVLSLIDRAAIAAQLRP
jgi:predicted ester cyclase